ncbi:hypothetical protein SAMN05421810_103342 [Amycolatopsis arida]|uniref:Uncharacterized protein n=1 Tax=Amycolatopsis arida TaxID=587909 RepID=A0A1I5T1V9_9PSEU|nr:hypothetical protein CLV69_103416 [Amycolatopsis arida]SFP76446.1 hypothetical protein SAMN05421810_103342 [Amycolatopsis arida]
MLERHVTKAPLVALLGRVRRERRVRRSVRGEGRYT